MLALPETVGMHPGVCEEAAELCFWVEVASGGRQKTSEKFRAFRKEIYEAPTCQWIRKPYLLLCIRLVKNFQWIFLLSTFFSGLQSQPVLQQTCCCFKIMTFIEQQEGLAVLCWTRGNSIPSHCSNPEDRTEIWERKVTAGGSRAGDASVPDKVHVQLWDAPQTGVLALLSSTKNSRWAMTSLQHPETGCSAHLTPHPAHPASQLYPAKSCPKPSPCPQKPVQQS